MGFLKVGDHLERYALSELLDSYQVSGFAQTVHEASSVVPSQGPGRAPPDNNATVYTWS